MPADGTALIALISAGAALAGAAISQAVALWQSDLERKHQHRIHLRTKYEELSDYISEEFLWQAKLHKTEVARSTSGEGIPLVPFPVHSRRATALAHVYFPVLRKPCQDYLKACVHFHVMLVEGQEGMSGGSVLLNAAARDKAAFDNASNALAAARNALDKAVITHAETYAGS